MSTVASDVGDEGILLVGEVWPDFGGLEVGGDMPASLAINELKIQ